ncbi:XdhC family protein [Acaryochloris sp. 'Moss Beach']|nr:XdhC family protein [Acaryochloris sp. 'Moss Beach']
MKELQEIIPFVIQADHQDPSIIVATVLQAEESSYCKPGTRILLTKTDQTIKAICEDYVDQKIIDQVKQLVQINASLQVYRYHVDCPHKLNKTSSQGGTTILLEPLNSRSTRAQFDFIAECYSENQSGAIATVFTVEGAIPAQIASRLFLKMDGSVANQIGDHFLTNLIFQDTVKILAAGQTRTRSYPFIDGYVQALIEVITPPIQLYIFGITPYTSPITLLAKQLGWTVVIIEHPSQDIKLNHFPEADHILKVDTQDLPKQIQLSSYSAAVVMTGNFEQDLAIVKFLWSSAIGYLGIPGTKARAQQLIQGLQGGGTLTTQQLNRLHGPIGLDIGAETPSEIALAIVSEIQAVVKHRTGSFLREQQNSIHDSVPDLISLIK